MCIVNGCFKNVEETKILHTCIFRLLQNVVDGERSNSGSLPALLWRHTRPDDVSVAGSAWRGEWVLWRAGEERALLFEQALFEVGLLELCGCDGAQVHHVRQFVRVEALLRRQRLRSQQRIRRSHLLLYVSRGCWWRQQWWRGRFEGCREDVIALRRALVAGRCWRRWKLWRRVCEVILTRWRHRCSFAVGLWRHECVFQQVWLVAFRGFFLFHRLTSVLLFRSRKLLKTFEVSLLLFSHFYRPWNPISIFETIGVTIEIFSITSIHFSCGFSLLLSDEDALVRGPLTYSSLPPALQQNRCT